MMVDVVIEEDCGNAPKQALIKDWLVSLATGEIDAVTSQLAEDARWNVAGSRTFIPEYPVPKRYG